MEHRLILALERMAQLERVMNWFEAVPITSPKWPESGDTASVTKQAVASQGKLEAATPWNQMVSALAQVEQAVHAQSVTHQRLVQAVQPATNTYAVWNGGAVRQQSRYAAQTQQSHWAQTVQTNTEKRVDAPTSLRQQTQTSNQQHQTTVNLSPTVHLQATVREQADLDTLVAKLNRMLEEEIAISAERAYT